MTLTLVRKLLRDLAIPLAVVMVLLFLFQLLWALVTRRIAGELLGQFHFLGISVDQLRSVIFQGPGQLIQTLMGGSAIAIERAQDMMSIAYVHPLTQVILCVWAIGRAAGAIAGEIDRGTMELLLAQPIRRGQVVLAHFLVDGVAIPLLCLALWTGTWTGTYLAGFHEPSDPKLLVEPLRFVPALLNVAALLFAVGGTTLMLSAWGRFRGRVMGLAVLLVLLQFLVNVIGQLWTPAEMFRPFTLFYYYHPQAIILESDWISQWAVWWRLAVLAGVGTIGYLMALWRFCTRDLPAPF